MSRKDKTVIIMRKSPFLLLAAALCACTAPSGETPAGPVSWGDQGNGTYINPILVADYSDPDVTRVGDTYYMVASDFHYMGMQILESKDLVNWTLLAQLFDHIDAPGYDTGERYAAGTWAPSIRYHDGKFYMFVCTPTEGLYMSCAERPEGPWSDLLLVHEGTGRGWEDPCPFWDEDGQAYLGRSNRGAGPIIIHKMSPDGTKLLDEGVEVYRGPTAEGTKIHKWNGMYYLSIPEGGVGPGWQTVLRSESIYGPYERKIVLQTGMTGINGPHQGAIVDTPDGQWWFFHFQRLEALGRVVHLQPMYWADGWPVIGVDQDRNGIGEPVYCWKMPVAGTTPSKPAASDDFDAPELCLQWQFNHNPVDGAWAVEDGRLRLDAQPAPFFMFARNTLTQKVMGFKGTYTVKMDCSAMTDGHSAGLACMGQTSHTLGIRQTDGQKTLYLETFGAPSDTEPFDGADIWLRFSFDIKANSFQFAYSADGNGFNDFGDPFRMRFGSWKGVRAALYSYMLADMLGTAVVESEAVKAAGTAWFDDFVYSRED